MKFSFKSIALAFIAAAACATSAFAAGPTPMNPAYYFESAYMPMNIKVQSGGSEFQSTPTVAAFSLGYKYNPNVAFEGLIGMGLSNDDVKQNGATTAGKIAVDSTYGFFVRPSVSLGDGAELTGRFGYVSSKVTSSGTNLSSSIEQNGFAYGVGVNFNLTRASYVSLNYLSAYNKDNGKADAWNIGYGIRF